MSIDFKLSITHIKKAKKHTYAIYLDNEFYAYIDTDVIYENALKEGMQASFDEMEEIKLQSDYKRAKNKALYLLDFRDYSKKDMKDKLLRDYEEQSVDSVIDFLEKFSFIDDERFAKNYIKKLQSIKGYAPRRISFELSKKGIDKNIIEDLMCDLEENNEEFVVSFLEKRIDSKNPDEKKLKKIISKLYRMGYSFDDVKNAVEKLNLNLPR